MQKVEDFMREFFRDRIAEEQRYQACRTPYRLKFFTTECPWESHLRTLEILQSEKILNVEASDFEAKVITVHSNAFYPTDSPLHKRRYRLNANSDIWLISNVEIECPMCLGQGDESCVFCKGKRWT